MTTEDGPAVSGERAAANVRATVMTKLPDRGSMLVRASAPPAVPTGRCVDVRPGPFATFDGDRFQFSLSVRAGERRRQFDRWELPAIGEAVAASLRDIGTADDQVTEPAVVRFGDRAALRRLLPTASVDAIERQLAAAVARESGVLLAWSSADHGEDDDGAHLGATAGAAVEGATRGQSNVGRSYDDSTREDRPYDVVLDRPLDRPG